MIVSFQIWKQSAVDVTRDQTEQTPVEPIRHQSDIDNCSVHAIRKGPRQVGPGRDPCSKAQE